MRKAAVVIGVVLAVLALVAIGLLVAGGLWVRAQGGYGPHMMMGWYGHPRGMGLFGGGLLMLVLFGVIAGAVVLLVVGFAGRKQKASEAVPTPLEILKRRYASGEIDREEFERMREELLK
jgi:putative membrane protein